MTRDEAERIFRRLATLERGLFKTAHARERQAARAFDRADIMAVLSSHVMERAPRWIEAHACFRVSLRGKCLAGRPTRLILDLRERGDCMLVTIMVIRR